MQQGQARSDERATESSPSLFKSTAYLLPRPRPHHHPPTPPVPRQPTNPQLLALCVSGAAPVSELKTRLSEETGLSAGSQYLLYQSKPLRDQATLAVYGLGGEAMGATTQPPTVTLCVRQKGGCFIVSFSILTVRCASCDVSCL